MIHTQLSKDLEDLYSQLSSRTIELCLAYRGSLPRFATPEEKEESLIEESVMLKADETRANILIKIKSLHFVQLYPSMTISKEPQA